MLGGASPAKSHTAQQNPAAFRGWRTSVGEKRMRTVSLMAAVVAILCSACGPETPTVPGTEDVLVPVFNQDFEEITSTGRLTNWGSDRWEWKVMRSKDAASGEWAVQFTNPAGAPSEEVSLVSDRVNMTPGANYSFSFAAKPGNGRVRATIRWFDDLNICLKDDGGECAELIVDAAEPGDDAYHYYTGTATVPETARMARGEVRFSAALPPGTSAYVDDVNLVPVR
jgi:hypothetical protein